MRDAHGDQGEAREAVGVLAQQLDGGGGEDERVGDDAAVVDRDGGDGALAVDREQGLAAQDGRAVELRRAARTVRCSSWRAGRMRTVEVMGQASRRGAAPTSGCSPGPDTLKRSARQAYARLRDGEMTTTARPLVGRDTELELLDRRLRDACGGEPRFVVVHGEPGIGKTSLLAELGRRAEQEGCLVLDGRATELERELPFARSSTRSTPTSSRSRRACSTACRPRSSPSWRRCSRRCARSAPAGGSVATATERYRAHHAVRELIERLAVRQPIVLMLDDLHWSDGASVELIGHLLRRPPDASVLVVAAHRTGRERPALAGAIEAAAARGPGGADRARAARARRTPRAC